MKFNRYYVSRYLVLLAILLTAFGLFTLFAIRYLVVHESFIEVFCKAGTFFGVPLTLYSVIRIFADETDSGTDKARHNICLFLASASIVVIGIIFR